MLSNLEQEELWIKGWDELAVLMDKYPECYLLIPQYRESTLDEALQWIQNAAYKGSKVSFKVEHYKGKESIVMDHLKS